MKRAEGVAISSDSLGQDLVLKMHDIAQLDAIYIYCGN
jgi:hypothetical protein